MKSNKGFTLIELLAVIVILAIIALIATPIILGVIETARKGSAESSVLGYVDAVEKQIAIDMLETDASKRLITISGSTIKPENGFKVKGATPTDSTMGYDSTTGTLTDSCFVITVGGTQYTVQYDADNTKAVATASTNATSCTVTPAS